MAGETVSITGPKGIATMVLILVAGGGIGATAVGTATGRDAAVTPLPYLSRAEVEAIAASRSDRAEERAGAVAKAFTAAEVAAAKDACEKKLSESLDRIGRKLDKLDSIAEDVALLKGAIRAKGR